MKKMKSREGKYTGRLIVFLALLVIAGATIAFADQGPAGGGGDGRFTRVINRLKNPFSGFSGSGLGGIFGDPAVTEVNNKPRIRPHFAFNQGFNSNARLGARQADAAWQARVAPGVTVAIPSGKLYTEADYTYGFSTTQGRKTRANISTHSINALARYDLSTDTTVGVGNNFQISEVPGIRPGEYFVLETATGQVRHQLSPKLSANMEDTFQWFSDRSRGLFAGNSLENDFWDNGVGLGFSYDVTSDLSLGPTFNWNVRNFKRRNAKDYWQISPAIAGSYRIGPKTTLGGSFGWAYRRFSEKTVTTVGSHESELVYGASVSHLLSRKVVWGVSYAKSIQDTFDTNFIFRDSPEATALDNLDRDFRVLKSHRVSSSVAYNISEAQSVGAFGDFQIINGDQDDNITTHTKNHEKAMEIGARYSYRLTRYITFDFLYSFGRRFTGDKGTGSATGERLDYTFHKVTGGVNIAV